MLSGKTNTTSTGLSEHERAWKTSSIAFGLLALTELCGIKEIPGILPSMYDCKGSSLLFPLGRIPKDGVAVNLVLQSLG